MEPEDRPDVKAQLPPYGYLRRQNIERLRNLIADPNTPARDREKARNDLSRMLGSHIGKVTLR